MLIPEIPVSKFLSSQHMNYFRLAIIVARKQSTLPILFMLETYY